MYLNFLVNYFLILALPTHSNGLQISEADFQSNSSSLKQIYDNSVKRETFYTISPSDLIGQY